MKLSSILSFASVTLATRVAWDAGYDPADRSLNEVACSNGQNGLENTHPGWTVLGNIASFPNIGAFQAVGGWNSASCGTCWQVSYGAQTLYVTAIDHAGDGAVLSKTAFNTLTGGHADEFGVVDAFITQVDNSLCRL
ncbi:epl1 protein [Microthyrium microscopicum]|uniref:Epl1 protein n=1 Tax=Microthyrium microscopicum TaxID=703497 RepID=A0A6A6TUG3_9PEZI|nr:epl1 protein [Microthyrium microscopicum]